MVFGSSRSMVKHLDSVVLDATSTCTFCRVGDPTETRNATSPGEFGIITFDTINCLAYWIVSRTKKQAVRRTRMIGRLQNLLV